jgi:hypothetical protein
MTYFLTVVGAVFLFFSVLKFSEWRETEDHTISIERKIPLSLFLASYEREPEKWVPLKYYVIFKNDRMRVDVTFQTAKERSRYRKWYESRKKQEEQERIDEQNRKLMDSIAEGYVESVTVESKPVEAEVPAEREWSVKRCGDCRHFWMQNPQQRSGYCSRIYPARINQYAYDIACEAFVDAKEREKVKQ